MPSRQEIREDGYRLGNSIAILARTRILDVAKRIIGEDVEMLDFQTTVYPYPYSVQYVVPYLYVDM